MPAVEGWRDGVESSDVWRRPVAQPEDIVETGRPAPPGYHGRRRRHTDDTTQAGVTQAGVTQARATSTGVTQARATSTGVTSTEPVEPERLSRGGRALVVAAVVGVLMLVVAVWIRWPRDDGHAAPPDQGPDVSETFPDDDGNPANGVTLGPSGTRSPRPGRPTPTTSPGQTPTPGATPTPTPTPGPTGSFTPVTIEAESATLGVNVVKAACSGCSGGFKVRFIGPGTGHDVTFTINSAVAGARQMVVSFEVAGTRDYQISVNGTVVSLSCTGGSWSSPATRSVTITLKAGSNTIRFFNDAANAPDLDKISIT
jgi:hypothetical protein